MSGARSARLTAGAVAALVVMALGSEGASAATNPWESFGSCPASDPAMVAVPAGTHSECVQLYGDLTTNIGTHQAITGTLATALGEAGDVQVAGPSSIYSDENQVGVEAPYVDICQIVYGFGSHQYLECVFGGGLDGTLYLGWIPDDIAGVTDLATSIQVTPELAGQPTGFEDSGLSSPGKALLTLPLKFKIDNTAFGSHCFVGSDQNPILIHLVNSTPPKTTTATDPTGLPIDFTFGNGGTATDTSFAEPGASGCNGLTQLVDLLLGLPRAAGKNTLTATYITGATASTSAGGQVLAQGWHELFH